MLKRVSGWRHAVWLASLCAALPLPAIAVPASPLVGTWGYTVLGHSNASDKGFYTWKTEAGTMQFNDDGTGHVQYQETADVCPDSNYCTDSDSYDVTYTTVRNADGTISATLRPAGSSRGFTLRFAVGDDGKMFVADGTRFGAYEQMSIKGVRLDTGHTYSAADASGNYYTTGYEYDMTGGDHGYYRAWTLSAAIDGAGNISQAGSLKADGVVQTGATINDTYTLSASGLMTAGGGAMKGYVSGDGALVMLANSGPNGGQKDDFASFFAMKKADKTYSTADVAGSWVFSGFGDDDGSKFFTVFGALNCDQNGQCSAIYKSKNSNRGSTIKTEQEAFNIQLAADGSYNGFLLDGSRNGFSGAVGNQGNTLVLNSEESGSNHRAVITAVRCSSCLNPGGVPDAAGPAVTMESPAETHFSATSATLKVTLSGTASDSGRGSNGVARVTINGVNALAAQATLDSSAAWSGEVELADGNNRIEIVATDFAGRSSRKVLNLHYLQDVVGPVLAVKAPMKPVMAKYADLRGTAFDREKNGVQQVTVNAGTVLAAPVQGRLKAVWNATVALTTGENSILVQATDSLGNVGEKTVVVNRIADTLPPAVVISSHRNNQHVKGCSINLSGRASDAKTGGNGIDLVTVSLNGGLDETADGGSTEKTDIGLWSKMLMLSGGANTIVVKATDRSGENAGSQKSLTLYCDVT